jgi:hypothetical protein
MPLLINSASYINDLPMMMRGNAVCAHYILIAGVLMPETEGVDSEVSSMDARD